MAASRWLGAERQLIRREYDVLHYDPSHGFVEVAPTHGLSDAGLLQPRLKGVDRVQLAD
jgi:hypothetical protein